jgi:alpha-beta hydrolase superfamily lysophospholipase
VNTMIESFIDAPDGHKVQTLCWPVDKPKAWVHINHGMSEHAHRYDQLAQTLNTAGYSVVAHNHRGHGSSPTTTTGHYADKNGWNKLLADVDQVRTQVCDNNLPYYLMGHSMGSFIVQSYLANPLETQRPIDALILSGSNFQAPQIAKVGHAVARLERWRLGNTKASKLLQFLSFGSFNQAFKPNRTDFDWLSKDHDHVDKYINDPLCGFDCSTQLWVDLLGGLIDLFTLKTFNRIQKNLPIYIFGGDQDPVGEKGKGLPKLMAAYKNAGQQNVTLKLYEEGRHEMLNEINRDEVMADIANWLNTL